MNKSEICEQIILKTYIEQGATITTSILAGNRLKFDFEIPLTLNNGMRYVSKNTIDLNFRSRVVKRYTSAGVYDTLFYNWELKMFDSLGFRLGKRNAKWQTIEDWFNDEETFDNN